MAVFLVLFLVLYAKRWEITWSMNSTVGVPHLVVLFVRFFELGNQFWNTQCMKRRCFDLYVIFTDVAATLLVQFHKNPLFFTPLMTPCGQMTVQFSIKLENSFCK